MRIEVRAFLFNFLAGALCIQATYASALPTPRAYIKSMFSLPLTLDHIQMNDTASLVAGNLIYEGLVKFSPTLNVEPSLAEHYETSPDGMTITFKLDQKAKFHDLSPVTADDVVSSLKRAASKESKVWKYYDCIVGVDDNGGSKSAFGVTALDSSTIQIKLKHPYPPILSILAGATAKVLPRKLLNEKDFFNAPIGSGPFRFASRSDKDRELILKRFDNFHGQAAKLYQITFRQADGADVIKPAEVNKVDDLLSWPIAAQNVVFKFGQKITSPQAATWIIGLNSRVAPFSDLAVRKAFSSDIDAEAFRQKFFPDAFQAFGYIPPGLPGYKSKASAPEALTATKPSKQLITIAIPAEIEDAAAIKAFIETAYQKRGWRVKADLVAWDKLMKGYSGKTLQGFLVSMNMDYPDVEFFLKNFESNNPDNFSGFKDAKLDSLLSYARTIRDRTKREQVYDQAIDLVSNAALTIRLFHPKANYWVSKCVTGFEPNILSEVYIDYSKIEFKENCNDRIGGI